MNQLFVVFAIVAPAALADSVALQESGELVKEQVSHEGRPDGVEALEMSSQAAMLKTVQQHPAGKLMRRGATDSEQPATITASKVPLTFTRCLITGEDTQKTPPCHGESVECQCNPIVGKELVAKRQAQCCDKVGNEPPAG